MSGAELLAQLRATGLLTMPIMLVTAKPQEATPLLVPGSIVCLAKPLDLDDLLACVARYVLPVYSVGAASGAPHGLSGRGRAG